MQRADSELVRRLRRTLAIAAALGTGHFFTTLGLMLPTNSRVQCHSLMGSYIKLIKHLRRSPDDAGEPAAGVRSRK